MNGEEFTETDINQIKKRAQELYSLVQEFDRFLQSEKELPIGIQIRAEFFPALIFDKPTPPTQIKIWREVREILELEFSGEPDIE